MKILLKKATVINSQSNFHFQQVDLLIDSGKIVQIATDIDSSDAKVIQKPNLHVSCGWFDSSVCFGEPGFEERETLANGLRTASKSGFTDIALEPVGHPVTDSQSTVIHLKQAGQHTATHIHPIACFTKGQQGTHLTEMYDLQNHGAIAFGDFNQGIKNAEVLRTGLLYAQRFNGLIIASPQDACVGAKGVAHEGITSTQLGLSGIPSLNEILQLQRDIELLTYTGGKLHIPFISTAESVEMIRKAKKKGLAISCSVALANLCLTEEDIHGFNTDRKLSPPLRSKKDQVALKEGVIDGTIDLISAHHQPLNIELKHTEFEHANSGTIGLEAMFGVLNTIFPTEKAIQLLTKGKTIFGLKSTSIAEGEKAVLTLFNPEGNGVFNTTNILSTSKNCAFIGLPTQGTVYGVIHENQIQL